jgi:hypothetical protein
MPDKSGSNRIGWNQRGPTDKDILADAIEISEIMDPNSRYWMNRTYQTRDMLVDCMGEKEFEEWAERMFPGIEIDSVSWSDIHSAYDGKFQRIQAEIAMVDDHDQQEDPRHIKTNGVY